MTGFIDFTPWSGATLALHILIAVPTALHVLLHKHNERAAIGWMGLVWLAPFWGSALYWIFGINRVKSRARRALPGERKNRTLPADAVDCAPGLPEKWWRMMKTGQAIHKAPYLQGQQITPLVNGDEAYPRMLAAIESARRDVVLSSYIFDYDAVGKQFVEALGRARKRGVNVHVLLDGYLLGWRWRLTNAALRRHGIITARYLPYSPRVANLRNHRKILSVDGTVAFIGGINIRAANLVKSQPRVPVQDMHFEVRGPVIDQINQIFSDDWFFGAGQELTLSAWAGDDAGPVIARALPDGPDENYKKLEWTLLEAVNAAERTIRIATPYFIPSAVIISALEAAALRGVSIDVLVPQKSNIPLFDWAMQANFNEYHKFGIRIYETGLPFDHSKLFLVDDLWSFIGSANWDERSLSLNFEINLECYDAALNAQLTALFDGKRQAARLVEMAHPKLWQRLRNNFLHLFSPYL